MSNVHQVLYLYNENREMEFRLTAAEFNSIRQLVRFQLAELIEDDAINKMIDHFAKLDVSLTTQHEKIMSIVNNPDSADELPF
jgi:hypothetical protein